jgi:hypothetical protein
MTCGSFLRWTGAAVVASAAALAVAGPIAASPTLDQEQPVIDTSSKFVYAIGGGSQQKLAQVVTPARSGILTEVRLSAACDATLALTVEGVTAGVPNGVAVAATTVSLPGPFPTTFRSIPLSPAASVEAGHPYALVLATDGSCGMWPGPLGDPYPGGDAFFDSRPNPAGLWVPLGPPRNDLPFQTFVDPADTTPPTAACVGAANPAGANVPPAAGPVNGNPDGFFELRASDDVGVASIVIRDSGSNFVSALFANGDTIKITQATGATPSETRPGPGTLEARLVVTGTALLQVTDTSGNIESVACSISPRSS